MSASTPVTQRDVAHACGLHPSTVCLALQNSPSIPVETRRRIQAVAHDLGYHPNVAARNLALLRNEKKVAGSLPIAWINQESDRDHWHVEGEAREYFEGAQRQAEALGYHLDEIWTRESGMTAARVAQIVRARGITGVLFPTHRRFDFSLFNPGWSDFALAGFNDYRLGEWIDLVCADYYRNTDLALRRLRHSGFERIGLVLTAQFDAATDGLVHSCFLRYQADLASDHRVPVCFVAEDKAESDAVQEWLGEYRPDVVLGRQRSAQAAASARSEPAWAQLHGRIEDFDAGVDPCPAEIAAAAVDCVTEKMRRFETGIRESTRLHLIKGVWQERRLVRREAASVVA